MLSFQAIQIISLMRYNRFTVITVDLQLVGRVGEKSEISMVLAYGIGLNPTQSHELAGIASRVSKTCPCPSFTHMTETDLGGDCCRQYSIAESTCLDENFGNDSRHPSC